MKVATNVALGAINAGGLHRAVVISCLLSDCQRVLKIVAKKDINIDKLRIALIFLGHVREKPLSEYLPARTANPGWHAPSENVYQQSGSLYFHYICVK